MMFGLKAKKHKSSLVAAEAAGAGQSVTGQDPNSKRLIRSVAVHINIRDTASV